VSMRVRRYDAHMDDDQVPAQYERRTLAYFDILGWKDVVQASVEEPALVSHLVAALSAPDFQARILKGSVMKITRFSDHVCFSVPGIGPPSIRSIATNTNMAVHNLMRLGFCVRGALVDGFLIHDQQQIFGPALLDAHYIESRVAKYPRIVLSESVAKWFEDDSIGFLQRHTPRLKDRDGLSCLDVLANIGRSEIQWIRQAIQNREPKKPDMDVRAKRNWIMSYLDSKEENLMEGSPSPA
jgi:hypothetical protein